MSQTTRKLNISLDELIEAKAEEMRYGEMLPTDWTVSRAVEEKGLSPDQARKMFKKLLLEGKVISVKVKNPKGGTTMNAYRLKE